MQADKYVDTNAYVGAFHDMECRTTSATNFESPIYFHPALVQHRATCRPDLDDDDVENIVGIPIVKKRRLHWNSSQREYQNHYNIEVDLYRPQLNIETGGVYETATESNDRTIILLGEEDDVNVGDTVFVWAETTEIFTVDDVIYNDDGSKRVVLDNARASVDFKKAGWVLPDDNDPQVSADAIVHQLRLHDTLQHPTFAGVCGPLQPIAVDAVLMHFMVLLTGNCKIIVDQDFYDFEWLAGDDVEMRLSKTDDGVVHSDDGVLDRYKVTYTHPEDAADDDLVWRCIVGQFIIEADEAWQNAAYIKLNGPKAGDMTTTV